MFKMTSSALTIVLLALAVTPFGTLAAGLEPVPIQDIAREASSLKQAARRDAVPPKIGKGPSVYFSNAVKLLDFTWSNAMFPDQGWTTPAVREISVMKDLPSGGSEGGSGIMTSGGEMDIKFTVDLKKGGSNPTVSPVYLIKSDRRHCADMQCRVKGTITPRREGESKNAKLVVQDGDANIKGYCKGKFVSEGLTLKCGGDLEKGVGAAPKDDCP